MRRVAGVLALLVVLSGCAAGTSAAPSSTTFGPTTSSSGARPSTTTTEPPGTTTVAADQGLCSASNQNWVLEDQPGLPAPVADKRAAVFAAAAACDFEELENLAGSGEGFTGPLANGVHPGTAEAFRDEESREYNTLWWLLTTLNLPYSERSYTYGDGSSWNGYVWPAAVDMDWEEIPADLAAVLRELYAWYEGYLGEDWDRGPFYGFKVMITPEGTWVWVGHAPA